MKLEVLISAMHLDDMSIAEKTKCNSDVLIINQADKNDYCEVTKEHTIRMITTTERGLSNSRNLAIRNDKGDICLICDDDEELEKGYERIILNAFDKIPEADIIAFGMRKKRLDYVKPRYTKIINYGASKKAQRAPFLKTYASVQLAFRRESIMGKELFFDRRFGAGSGKISCGEETVWQVEAKRKGLKIFYWPEIITTIRQDRSVWFNGLNEKYYYDLGACLGVNYPYLKHILKFYYIFFIKGSQLSFFEQLKWLNIGIVNFSKWGLGYDEYCMKHNTSG